MFDINKLDPESRAFYNSLPQIARDAIEKSAKSGVRFENVDDLRDYYYNYIKGYDSVIYQNTPDANSSELDPDDSYI
ncbi:MAG: hypothetical protein GX193_09050 [Clostridiales bacterium]|nr:hypothetical protein [Clostridiales bacterium]